MWGESEEGQKKPFRFSAEPSNRDIEAELGDFKQRMNYEGTALEAPKFGLSFFCFDYADSKIKVFEITQKTLIKELDKLSQDEDYADIHAWDLKVNRTGLKMNTEYSILPSPRKKGSDDEIKAAWSAALKNRVTICSNSWWVAILLDLEAQVDLVDQVMRDRSITSPTRPSQTTPAGAGSSRRCQRWNADDSVAPPPHKPGLPQGTAQVRIV